MTITATTTTTSPVMSSEPSSARTSPTELANSSSQNVSARTTPSIIVDTKETEIIVVQEESSIAQRFSTLLEISQVADALFSARKEEEPAKRPTTAAQYAAKIQAPKEKKKFEWKKETKA